MIITTLALIAALKNKNAKSFFIISHFVALGIFSANLKKKNFSEKNKIDCVSYVVEIVDEKKNIAKIVAYKNFEWHKNNFDERVKLISEKKFQEGELILLPGYPHEIKNYVNPFCFDYKKFFQDKNIFFQHQIISYKNIGTVKRNYFFSFLRQCQTNLKKIFDKNISDRQARSVIAAMLLGIKDDIDEEIKNIYTTTGVIHVLAVSGLHVGIIFFCINIFLGFFLKKKSTRAIKLFLTITLLWFYAGLTGFSPSVVRATIMCSLMLLCNFFSRENQIQSSISITALLMTLWDPSIVYNIAFQLSFCAVIGIVLFQKKIFNCLSIKNKILRYCWETMSVTLSAQMFTLPLIFFYTKKFSTYFLFSNLIIIPLCPIIVALSLFLIFVSPITFLSQIISTILNFILVIVNKLMWYIAAWPYSQISDINVDFFDIALMYGFIFCLFLFFEKEKIIKPLYILSLLFITKNFFILHKISQQKIFIAYDLKPHWAITYINGSEAVICADKNLEEDKRRIENQIMPSLKHYHIKNFRFCFYDDEIKIFSFDGIKIGVLNRRLKNFFPAREFEFDYVIDNSFVKNISSKVNAKKIIYTYTNDYKEQTTPCVIRCY